LRLQAEDILDIVPRGGAFVRSTGAKAIIASGSELKQSGSFVRAMEQQGRQIFVRFIEPSSIVPAGNEMGTKMSIDPDVPVLRRYRVHLVDRVPSFASDFHALVEGRKLTLAGVTFDGGGSDGQQRQWGRSLAVGLLE
jgi:DNA-binding GntR family transcriptional regulator